MVAWYIGFRRILKPKLGLVAEFHNWLVILPLETKWRVAVWYSSLGQSIYILVGNNNYHATGCNVMLWAYLISRIRRKYYS